MAKPLRGEVDVTLAGEPYTLRIGIGEIEEIENMTGLGLLEILKCFGNNAKVLHAVAVLSQAIVEDGKKMGPTRVRRLMERAGFREYNTACVQLLTAVLFDPTPGNGDAVALETEATA